MANSINHNILIVSDSKYEMENIQQLLKAESGIVLKAFTNSDGVSYFKKHHPKLIILAYENVNDAEKFYMSLYVKDQKIHQAPHKTLLLCRGQESELAYDLCFNGIMDDYVADRPMFDPYRLKLSVRKALYSHSIEQNNYLFMSQLEQLKQDVAKINHFMKNQLQRLRMGDEHINESFDIYIKQLINDVKMLERQVSPLFEEDSEEKEELLSALNTLNVTSINQGRKNVDTALTNAKDIKGDLAKSLDLLFDNINKNSESKIDILVVDDDPIYLEILKTTINSDVFNLHTVPNGKAAMDYIKAHQPKIILLDYEMPIMNGIEVLKQIKQIQKLKNIPVIMLTVDSSRERVKECVEAGAIEYIVKPSTAEIIQNKIKTVLNL